MRKIFNIFVLILLSVTLFISCSKGIEDSDEVFKENANDYTIEKKLDINVKFSVINFRTPEGDSLTKKEYIIKEYDEFISYIDDYKIIENPFFIEKENLNLLTSVDEDFFFDKGLIISVFVEDNPETIVKGESTVIKDKVIELYIERQEVESDINELATRHVVFIFDLNDIKSVEDVKVKTTIK